MPTRADQYRRPSDLKLQEAAAATQLVGKAIHPEAQIIWGLSLDDAYGDEVRVTVIAAGFDANSKKAAQAEAQKQAEPAESTVPLSALSAARGSGGSAAAPASAYSDSGSPEGAAAVHLYSVHSGTRRSVIRPDHRA